MRFATVLLLLLSAYAMVGGAHLWWARWRRKATTNDEGRTTGS